MAYQPWQKIFPVLFIDLFFFLWYYVFIFYNRCFEQGGTLWTKQKGTNGAKGKKKRICEDKGKECVTNRYHNEQQFLHVSLIHVQQIIYDMKMVHKSSTNSHAVHRKRFAMVVESWLLLFYRARIRRNHRKKKWLKSICLSNLECSR